MQSQILYQGTEYRGIYYFDGFGNVFYNANSCVVYLKPIQRLSNNSFNLTSSNKKFQIRKKKVNKSKLCPICKKSFYSYMNKDRHMENVHGILPGCKYQCSICRKQYKNFASYKKHMLEIHKKKLSVRDNTYNKP